MIFPPRGQKEDKMDYQIDHALQAAINRLLLRVVQGGRQSCR